MKKLFTNPGIFALAFIIANLLFANRTWGQLGSGTVTVTSTSSCVVFAPGSGNGNAPDNYRIVPGGTYIMTITGVTECTGNYITVFVQNSGSTNFCFNAFNNGSGTTYSGTFVVPSLNCLTSPVSYKCGESQPCNNSNTFNARSINGQPVHLDAYTWGGNCTPLTQVTCGSCIPTVPVFDNCTNGTTDLGCNPTPPVCATNITAHNNCGTTVQVTCQPGVIITNGCNRSQTFTYTATGDGLSSTCEKTFTWTEDHTGPNVNNNPPISIQALCTATFTTLPWQAPVWGDNCDGTITVTDVISPNQQQTTCPVTYTRTWTATDACGNPSTFTQSINVPCCTICTYTQGYYGNAGGLSCNGTVGGLSTAQQITNAINSWGGTLTVGLAGKSVFITNSTSGYVNCVINKLPGGGPAKELAAGNVNICNLPSAYLKNGRINNVLLSQTITLGINMGIMTTPNLSGFVLQGGALATAQVVNGCGGTLPVERVCLYDPITHLLTGVQNEYTYYTIDPAVVNALGPNPANRTVGALFNLANRALANQDGTLGMESGVSLSAITNAIDAINNAFDGCRIPVGFNVPPCSASNNAPVTEKGGNTNQAKTSTAVASSKIEPVKEIISLLVNAYPNPYTDQVKFVISSPESGQGILEIYTLTGQKLQIVSAGYIIAGIDKVLEYKVSDTYRTSLFYIFRVGDKSTSGKLVNIRQVRLN